MRATTRAALTLAAGLMFVACSSEEDPEAPPPTAFSDRTPLPSCGEITAKGPDFALDQLYPQRVLACMTNSRSDSGAELSVTEFTTDGDPINTFYRTAGDLPTVEIFLDKSADKYSGGKDWVQFSCEVPILTADALRTCSANY